MRTITFSNGKQVINCTAYPITFVDMYNDVIVPTSGIVLSAEVKIDKITEDTEEELFVGTSEGWENIEKIRDEYPDIFILGTSKAAIAYKGEVVYGKPASGYEDKPPAIKKFDPNVFRVVT